MADAPPFGSVELGCPLWELIFATRQMIVLIIHTFLVLTGTTQKLFFRIIWRMGGSRCVQNTPTEFGNDLPNFSEITFPPRNMF